MNTGSSSLGLENFVADVGDEGGHKQGLEGLEGLLAAYGG